jgi:uncharacterized protein YjbK
MYTCDYIENELKFIFEYSLDYVSAINSAFESLHWTMKKKSVKAYHDYYYDTPDFKLANHQYSFRLRFSDSKNKLHLNFKYPFVYNENGIVSRREVKCELAEDEFDAGNIEDSILSNSLPIEHLKRFLRQTSSFERKAELSTHREFFVLGEQLSYDSRSSAFGVMCLDHSKIIYSSDECVTIPPQIEIELWNNHTSLELVESLKKLANTLSNCGFYAQTSSRYTQILSRG